MLNHVYLHYLGDDFDLIQQVINSFHEELPVIPHNAHHGMNHYCFANIFAFLLIPH